jgi:hypothetical protein
MPNSGRSMTNANIADILGLVEVARIELEFASADLTAQGGFDRCRPNVGHLETMLTSLRLARTALATAQASLGDSAAGDSPRTLTLAMS